MTFCFELLLSYVHVQYIQLYGLYNSKHVCLSARPECARNQSNHPEEEVPT